jgi:hypothetical protein
LADPNNIDALIGSARTNVTEGALSFVVDPSFRGIASAFASGFSWGGDTAGKRAYSAASWKNEDPGMRMVAEVGKRQNPRAVVFLRNLAHCT